MTEKTCPDCDRRYPIEDVVCVPCEHVFEEGHYLRWIGITGIAAVVIVWLLARAGVLERFAIREAFKLCAFLLLVLYPAAKLVQRIRDRRRPVLREMGSVFSSRFDRAMVTALLVAGLLLLSGAAPKAWRPVEYRGWESVQRVVSWFVALGGFGAALAMVADQGWRFFDPRIRNTYVERYRGTTGRPKVRSRG